jgi:hypothetical protein
VNLYVLAADEGVKNPTLWYPTILGVLVVVAAVGLFCGSIYLLLATNLGARLGFLVAASALTGFMVLLSLLWLTKSSPLDTLKGRIPVWKPVESVGPDLAGSKIPAVRTITSKGKKDDAQALANVKAFVDQAIITQKPALGEVLAPDVNKYAVYTDATDYLVTNTYETGGGHRAEISADGTFPFVHVSTHVPKYAVATICPVDKEKLKVPLGDPIPAPTCDTAKPVANLVLERDLGSLRIPPFVAFLGSSILFGLTLLALHWRERDLQQAAAATISATTPATTDGATPDDPSDNPSDN